MTTLEAGNVFDIDREVYTKWCEELDRINVSFMLCGHYHRALIIQPDDSRNLIPHKYPVIVGVENNAERFLGAAIILNKDKMDVMFTDAMHRVHEKYVLKI